MKNAVGREIPEELLVGGKEVYQGKYYMDGKTFHKAGPTVRRAEKPQASKVLASIREACEKCGAHDGMTVSFHHAFRNGDYVTSMVMKVLVEEMGLKDLTVATTSLGSAQDLLADYIEEGKIIGIQSSGVRGRIGEVISAGKLKTPAIVRSHGGRPRAIETGELHLDITFIAASASDDYGNANGTGGKNNCGTLGYAVADSRYADHVVVVTDTLVPFPNSPASIPSIDVDYVVVVDEIGDPKKIGTKEARVTEDPRNLMMAENCASAVPLLRSIAISRTICANATSRWALRSAAWAATFATSWTRGSCASCSIRRISIRRRLRILRRIPTSISRSLRASMQTPRTRAHM